LDPALTSPYRFYQFWVNVDDRDVESYLKLFTLNTRDQITDLVAKQKKDPAARPAQRALAQDVTTRAHGGPATAGVMRASAVLFGDFDPHGADDGTFDVLAQEVPTAPVPAVNSLGLVEAVVQAGLAKSKSEARRAIEQGGIYLNQERVKDASRTLQPRDWVAGRNVLLRKGKKEFALLRVRK